jgi:hypothetical protein
MARRVFFSFEYSDVFRAMVVRNSWVTQDREAVGFIDSAEFEEVEAEGDDAIDAWIDEQLAGTSVTVVLVGAETCESKWVSHEIVKSIDRGNGVLGIDISKIKDVNDKTTDCCGQIPTGYSFYRWNKDDGYHNMGAWIEAAAKAAGK